MDQKKGLHLELCADFREFWGKDKKKLFISKKCANFHELRGETTKKRVFITKSAKNFLITNSGVITCIVGVSALELQFSGTSLLLSLGHNPRLGGTILVWGVYAVIWGSTVPECPSWRRACCKFTAIYRTVMGFIEEMRTI